MAFIILQTSSLVWILLLFTCTALLSSHDHEDCLALFQFKQNIFHQASDSWRKTKSNTSDCCLFYGVVCSNNGHVIGIDWSESSLSGVINSSSTLFKLVHLQTLNLSMNNFVESQIPAEIGRLNQLRSLDLSMSGFYGQIPNEISQLAQLSSLDLSWNPLKLQSPGLEYLLQNMTRLENIHLSRVNLGSSVPRFLANFSSLRSIKLSSCLLQDEFPFAIFHLPKLKYLSMGNNTNLTGSLPEFHNNTLLEELYLWLTGFAGIIPESIGNLNHLNALMLESSHFSGRIPDNIFEDVFPLWLGALPKLQVLILRSNIFYGAIHGLSTISSQFLKLRIIDISNNDFSGNLPDKSFQTWNAMKSPIVGESSIMKSEIPFPIISTFNYPYSVTLTNKGVKREYFEILNIFTAIDLSCNNFEGQIPQSLQDLHGLESLNLSNNHFTGPILPSMGNLKNLESLDISQNNLSGKIPQQLLQLNFLAFLNVSFNHLVGGIPQGKQFNTFENNSYLGNYGLCGEPLSKECGNPKVSTVLPQTTSIDHESWLPSDKIDWMVILLGVGSGLAIGIVYGWFLYARYGDWLLERFGMKKDKWVRPLRNTRRN